MSLKKLSKKLFITVMTVLLVTIFSITSLACTNVLVGKDASTDGSVFTSHTVDGRYDSRLRVIPAQDHEEGDMLTIYFGKDFKMGERPDVEPRVVGEIPQVDHTYKYFESCYSLANEHQVFTAETTQGGAIETRNNEDEAIMSIRMLSRIALQRATTAREAVEIMGELALEYGFAETAYLGECLSIADPNEVWMFEIYGAGPFWTKDSDYPGAAWVAGRVPDNHVSVNPNYSRFREIDPDNPDLLVSEGYIDLAVELELYDPDEDGEFIWNEVYGNVGPGSDRLWRLYSLLKPSVDWKLEETHEYPFSIEPDEKVSLEDLIALFRDENIGSEVDVTEHENWYYENDEGEMVKSPLASPQTRYVSRDLYNLLGVDHVRHTAIASCSSFWVGQARDWMPDEIGGVLWYGLNNPANSPFIPLYLGADEIPESYSVLNRDAMDYDSAWWAFARVDDVVNRKYQEYKPRLHEELLDPMQNYWFNMQDAVDSRALDIYEEHGSDEAREFLTSYSKSQMEWAEQSYWDYFDELYFSLTGGY